MNKFKKTSFWMILFLLLALLVMVSLSNSFAADTNITNSTAGGLNNAVNQSANNDRIILSDGTYTGDNNTGIVINKNLTITGTNKVNTVLDLGGGSKLFTINSGASLILANLTIKNAQIGNNSYLINNDGRVTIQDCVFTDNTINNLLISRSVVYKSNPNDYTVQTNISTGYLVLNNGDMVIQDSHFNNNKMNIQYNYYEEIPYTTNTTIISNIPYNTTYIGGGGLVVNRGRLNITRSNFTNNNIQLNQNLTYNYSANENIRITRQNNNNTYINSQTTNYVYASIVNTGQLEITQSTFTNNTNNCNVTRNYNKNITIATSGDSGKITTNAGFYNVIFNSANINVRNSEFTSNGYNTTWISNNPEQNTTPVNNGGAIYTSSGISNSN
ncbi:hypothetical protein, partial [Methanobrevibacter cuticularis]|uniref:hypothetical protein n=1 Tax=Methanobrevibacter cuticularis TaxID=47311 RepID=UPI000ABFE77E